MNRVITEDKSLLGTWIDAINLSKRQSGVAILELNIKGLTNSLSSEVLNSFCQALEIVKQDQTIKALIIHSGKEDIFVTGADIKEISKLKNVSDGQALAQRGQNFLSSFLELHCPTISAIHGTCLGGGLELALCSDKRIATSDNATKLGLPELTLGLIPGLGGTQRLPRLVGFRKAIDMILSGEPVSSEQALEIGLIDKIVEKDSLLEEAERIGLQLANSDFDRATYRLEIEAKRLEKDGGEKKRKSILKMSQRVVRMRGGEHYPAPKRAIEALRIGFEESIEKGLEEEVNAFGELACSEESRNLISFYFSKEMASQLANRASKTYPSPKTIAIIGSGFMGKGVAELAAEAGIRVLLKGSSHDKTIQAVDYLNNKLIGKDKDIPPIEAASDVNQLRVAEIVIESVNEDFETKERVLKELAGNLSTDSILASNTSSIPLNSLTKDLKSPEKLVGLHFFNPIGLMPLVEVISHDKTSKDTHSKALSLVSKLNKVPVSVKDSPGFIVNRILTCYITEAVRMAISGIPLNWIDQSTKKFGMPLGPFELLDELGWSLSRAVSNSLASGFGQRLKLPEEMDKPISLGYEGKQNNIGCYLFEDKSKNLGFNPDFVKFLNGRISEELPGDNEIKDIHDWLFLTMIDESARCLEEKIVRKARDIDLALVTGAGFPPFRGGLLRYADKLGIDYVITNLERVYIDNKQEKQVSKLLKDMHNIGRKFYSLG